MVLLDGKKASENRHAALIARVEKNSQQPHLVIVQVGNNPDSDVYVRRKQMFGERIGARVTIKKFSKETAQDTVIRYVSEQNENPTTHGIIVQLPLPENFDRQAILNTIDSKKDVDGLTANNIRKLAIGDSTGMIPATARGVVSLLQDYNIPISGKEVVVVGRSLLVGKSSALHFLNHDATVMICHSKTENLPEKTKKADILVVAAGQPGFIGVEHVSRGQVVVDVGITALGERQIKGDVDFDAIKDIVYAASPVPNGVGPMTVVSLFENLLDAAEK